MVQGEEQWEPDHASPQQASSAAPAGQGLSVSAAVVLVALLATAGAGAVLWHRGGKSVADQLSCNLVGSAMATATHGGISVHAEGRQHANLPLSHRYPRACPCLACHIKCKEAASSHRYCSLLICSVPAGPCDRPIRMHRAELRRPGLLMLSQTCCEATALLQVVVNGWLSDVTCASHPQQLAGCSSCRVSAASRIPS